MKHRLVNIGRGDFVIDKNTHEVVRSFDEAPIRGDSNNPNNDVAVREDQIVLPGSARDIFMGADEGAKKDIVKAAGFYHSALTSEKSPAYERWFKGFTVEGANGADPYDNENHYDYAKYYEEVVRDDDEYEIERNSVNAPIDPTYMTPSHPLYSEYYPMASRPDPKKDIQAIDDNIDAINFNVPLP